MDKDYTLRSYIPISGPGLREPCRGDESDFRVSLGFTPLWYQERLGIDFSRRWHCDPVYRYESLMAMKKYLTELFPSIEHFRPSVHDGVDPDCATISGVYGALLIPGLYKPDIHYFAGNWPSLNTSEIMPKEALSDLAPFDPETNPLFQDLWRQMDIIEKRWGMISGYIHGYQGVINTAFRLRGQNIFLDIIEDPDFVRQLFGHICETILCVNRMIQERQRKSGFEIDLCTSSNCVVNMISPEAYQTFVLPHDQRLSQAFGRYGIHTCNWNATPYIEEMRRIKKVGYIDMGMDTDLERMRRTFPDARRGVVYSPTKVCYSNLDEIVRDFAYIHEALGPCDIILADIEANVPTEKVQAIVRAADRIGRI
ncbi:MAG TPA: hypothetical protein DF613_00640 [Lachnospiraceae bacterium]|nr:hypothetical protein [Lachnospiraceae bacterium]